MSYRRKLVCTDRRSGTGVEDMAVQGVSIALSTEDVARSVKFYVQLGFTCTLQLGGFARVRLGAAEIMLGQPNIHLPWQGPRFTGSIYLDVDNVDELWESLKTRARIVYPIETMEYGVREFGLLDDNGYQLSFAQHVAAS
jgi:catechol 2,3-dioxygenase-like lactoylglutathione lyase family enzyme